MNFLSNVQICFVTIFYLAASSLALGEGRALKAEPRSDEWKAKHWDQINESRKNDSLEVVILGDSLPWGLSRLRNSSLLPGKRFFNYAHPGDRIEHALWRVNNGLLDGLEPKLVLLMVGTNNLRQKSYVMDPPEIVEGISNLVTHIRKVVPEAEILIYGVLPRVYKPSKNLFPGSVPQLNALLKEYCEREQLHFVDLSDQYQISDGKLRPGLYTKDGLHLSESGYALWIKSINEESERILKR